MILETYCLALKGLGIKFTAGEELSRHSTFRIGGPADIAVFPDTEKKLCQAVRTADCIGIRRMVAGNGSNLLFADEGFRGAVIFTSGLDSVTVDGLTVDAGAGAALTSVCRVAMENGLAGMEFAYGIPGSVGGAVYMNAGAYGGEMKDVVSKCRLYDSDDNVFHTVSADSMDFSYRHSILSGSADLILTGAVFELKAGNRESIAGAMKGFSVRRREKQPLEFPSAGSAFKRPAPDVFAGRLIQDAGLMGYTVGGAQVSEKHAGFIVNRGEATAADVLKLTEHIRKTVFEASGIELESEIIYVPEKEESV